MVEGDGFKYFVGREKEIEVFERLITRTCEDYAFEEVEGRVPIPEFKIPTFTGVAGAGKSWLRRKCNQVAADSGMKSISVDLDPRFDFAAPDRLCAMLINAADIDAPRTRAAIAFLLSYGNISPSAARELALDIGACSVQTFVEWMVGNAQALTPTGLASVAVKHGLKHFLDKNDPNAQRLKRIGEFHRLHPEFAASLRELEPLNLLQRLFFFFGLDFKDAIKDDQRAIQLVVLADSAEQAIADVPNKDDREERHRWMTQVMDACCTIKDARRVPRLLVVPFGQVAPEWGARWAPRLEIHVLDGLSKSEAQHYLQERRIPAERRAAILHDCKERGTETYHPLSLGLSVDLYRLNILGDSQFEVRSEASDERIVELEPFEVLRRRFYRGIGDEEAARFRCLALTSEWDRESVDEIWRKPSDDISEGPLWERITRLSFVRALLSGAFALHQTMVNATIKEMQLPGHTEEYLRIHRFWADHLTRRSDGDIFRFGYRIWEHRAMISGWEPGFNKSLLEEAVEGYRRILADSRNETDPESRARTLIKMGMTLRAQALSSKDLVYLYQSLDVIREALKITGKETNPGAWATINWNLGNSFYALGMRNNNPPDLLQGVEAFQCALELWTKEDFPQQWGVTHFFLGDSYKSLYSLTYEVKWLRQAERAWRLYLEVLGGDELFTPTVQRGLGDIRADLSRHGLDPDAPASEEDGDNLMP